MSRCAFVVIAFKRDQPLDWQNHDIQAAQARLEKIAESTISVYRGADFAVLRERSSSKPVESLEVSANGGYVSVCDGWFDGGNAAMHTLAAGSSDQVLRTLQASAPHGPFALVSISVDAGGRWQTIAAVRDHVGLRPLFVAESETLVAFSNFPGALASMPAVGFALNAGYAAEYLCGEVNSVRETHFANVERVLGGHFAHVTRARLAVVTARYWRPSSALITGNAIDIAGEFRRLLECATATACGDSQGSVLALSGGVDSSCLAVVLADQIECGTIVSSLSAANLVFDSPTVDETVYVDAVAAAVPFDVDRLQARYATASELETLTQRFLYPAGSFAGTSLIAIAEAMHGWGQRVLINGEGGDELLVPYAPAFWGALARPPEWSALRAHIATRYRRGAVRLPWRGRPRAMLEPWLGWAGQNWFNRHRDRSRRSGTNAVSEEVARRTALHDRLDCLLPPSGCRTIAIALAGSGFWSESYESLYWSAYWLDIEVRSPLMDIGLLEFCNRLPLAELDGPHSLSRRLLRACCAPRLPSIVAERAGKTEFSGAVLGPLQAVALERFGPGWESPELGAGMRSALSSTRTGTVWQLDAAQAYRAFAAALPQDRAGGDLK